MNNLYRKKPVIIESIQFTGLQSYLEMCAVWGQAPQSYDIAINGETLSIKTLEGTMTANLDDWIIKGVNGEFYPCKPDIFEKTYEAVE